MKEDHKTITLTLDADEATMFVDALVVYHTFVSQMPEPMRTQAKETALRVIKKMRPPVQQNAREEIQDWSDMNN